MRQHPKRKNKISRREREREREREKTQLSQSEKLSLLSETDIVRKALESPSGERNAIPASQANSARYRIKKNKTLYF